MDVRNCWTCSFLSAGYIEEYITTKGKCDGSNSYSYYHITKNHISRIFGMDNPVYVVDAVPDRPNIKCTVIQQPICIEEAFSSLVGAIRQEYIQMGRVIIYCCSYDDCSSVYLY